MKQISLVIAILCFIKVHSQEVISLNYAPVTISFEDAGDSQFVLIDTSQVWVITKPQKDLLNLPPSLGEYAIITDTNQYYRKNCYASFQFRLYLEHYDFYDIRFEQKFDFEINKDGGIIETSYDNGISWQNILFDTLIMNHIFSGFYLYDSNDTIEAFDNQPGFTGRYTSMSGSFYVNWQNYSVVDDTMLLRFTFASDSVDTPNEGWMLDEFVFQAGLVPIEQFSGKAPVELFPNPAWDWIRIRSEIDPIQQVQIFSITGNLLLNERNPEISVLDVSSLKKGIYYIVCYGLSDMVYFLKFLKL